MTGSWPPSAQEAPGPRFIRGSNRMGAWWWRRFGTVGLGLALGAGFSYYLTNDRGLTVDNLAAHRVIGLGRTLGAQGRRRQL